MAPMTYAAMATLLLSSLSEATRQPPEHADSELLAMYEAQVSRGGEGEHPDVKVGGGAWKWQPDAKWASPVCCGWDNGAFRAHAKECGPSHMPREHVNGGSIYRGRPDFLAHSGGHGCACADKDRPTPWHFVYSSHDEWDAERFCDDVGNRTVLFIGDSTMEQTASTVMNAAFGARQRCHVRMTMAMSDTLVGRSLGVLNRGVRWTELVDTMDPDIVVLTAGAHVHKCKDGNPPEGHCPEEYDQFNEVFDGEILPDILKYRESHPRRRILWKTQQPGGCSAEIDDGSTTFTDYNYEYMKLRDEHALKGLRRHGLPYVDLRMLYWRSDAHPGGGGGCLHMCIPGPLDIAPLALHRALRMADRGAASAPGEQDGPNSKLESRRLRGQTLQPPSSAQAES
mmetsp:Transcript_121419/g.377904  ORF Transcript_121419/g.377904 Transcript_121419/m.377904 type:complete len:397 (-) Transcript_121419:2-1192(-)